MISSHVWSSRTLVAGEMVGLVAALMVGLVAAEMVGLVAREMVGLKKRIRNIVLPSILTKTWLPQFWVKSINHEEHRLSGTSAIKQIPFVCTLSVLLQQGDWHALEQKRSHGVLL